MDVKLRDAYYKPGNLWKGKKAIKMLQELTHIKPKKVKLWLGKQAFWQVNYPGPRHIIRPHYEITTPNEMHQFDLLYMPGDELYGNRYKYILTGVDVASRYKVARPLRTKKASDVADMLKDIYKAGPLTYPKIFQCDNGSEFKGEVSKLLGGRDVVVRRTTTKYKHTHTAFVESFNRVLSVDLFKIQDAIELNDPKKIATSWVKHLYNTVGKLNRVKNRITGIMPVDAVVMKDVPIVGGVKFPVEGILQQDGLYRYLLMPGEEHDDTRRRATDRIWSKGVYRLVKVVGGGGGNRAMYFLRDGPNRSFVSEELMVVPENTENPPDYVKKW